MTPEEKAKRGQFEIFENEEGLVKVFKENEKWATVDKDGTLHWHNSVVFDGNIQSLGSKIELWQTVLSTGDNLIQLNDRIGGEGEEPPYAGIEVKRGKEKPSAYFLWVKESGAWETVFEGNRKKVATTEDIETVQAGGGIESIQIEGGKKIRQSKTTSTHNFWVSNEVVKTKGTDRRILPAFVSCTESENKIVSKIRCQLSTGTVNVSLLKNGKPVAGSFKVAQEVRSIDVDVPLEDGDGIAIEIDEANDARNLSVSVTVLTEF